MLIMLTCFSLAGCATDDRVSTSNGDGTGSTAHPAADIGNSFNVGAPRTIRERRADPNSFFFKECSESGNSVHYSKTSYYCN